MELKEFVKKVIVDLDQAVSEANTESKREVRFKEVQGKKTSLEFDVAVTAESTTSGGGGGEIKVWGIGQVGASGGIQEKNSTVSRISFGVDIAEFTKDEDRESASRTAKQFSPRLNSAR